MKGKFLIIANNLSEKQVFRSKENEQKCKNNICLKKSEKKLKKQKEIFNKNIFTLKKKLMTNKSILEKKLNIKINLNKGFNLMFDNFKISKAFVTLSDQNSVQRFLNFFKKKVHYSKFYIKCVLYFKLCVLYYFNFRKSTKSLLNVT